MADVIEVLGTSLTPSALNSLAKALGIDPRQATTLVNAVVPVIVQRLRDNATTGDGDNIATALNKDHDGSLLGQATGFLAGGFRTGPGMRILEHVFGDDIDGAIAKVAGSTGLPQPVVKLGFSALAPLAMGAITKAAIGAVTAVVVVKLLDMAVDSARSGKLQSALASVNDTLDRDNDGIAVDDVGRGAASSVKKGTTAVFTAGKKVVTNERVRAAAGKGARAGKKAVSTGATAAKRKLGGLMRRFRR
jgi:hypothetical protein